MVGSPLMLALRTQNALGQKGVVELRCQLGERQSEWFGVAFVE